MGIRPLMIGIAGGSGSGKTYLARKVLAQAGDAAALLSMDQYFRTVDGDRRLDPHDINFDHPAHLDLEGMVRDLTTLRAGEAILAPAYDFATQLQTPRAIPIPSPSRSSWSKGCLCSRSRWSACSISPCFSKSRLTNAWSGGFCAM